MITFWRIPKSIWVRTDRDGNKVQGFPNLSVYDETTKSYYVSAAELRGLPDRQDLADAGATRLGDHAQRLSAAEKARFFHVPIERDTKRMDVKRMDLQEGDVELGPDFPAVMWLGETLEDYAP